MSTDLLEATRLHRVDGDGEKWKGGRDGWKERGEERREGPWACFFARNQFTVNQHREVRSPAGIRDTRVDNLNINVISIEHILEVLPNLESAIYYISVCDLRVNKYN